MNTTPTTLGPLVIGIDLGTTNFKAAAIDSTGKMLAFATVPTPILHPSPGRWEMHPQALLEAVSTLLRTLSATVPLHTHAAALCIASQANSFLLLDRADHPCGPCILWPDARAAGLPLPNLPDTRHRCGIPHLDHEFTPAKLALCLNEQQNRKPIRFCFIADFVAHSFTGQLRSELSVAALSAMVDVHVPEWWPQAFTASNAADLQAPPLIRSGQVIGTVRSAIAAQIGLPTSCLIVAGALDQYASMIGAGAVSDGILAESTGTALAVTGLRHAFADNLASGYQGPLWQPASPSDPLPWARMTFSDTSASLLDRYRQRLPTPLSFEALDQLACIATTSIPVGRVRSLAERDETLDALPPDAPIGSVVRGIYQRVASELADLIQQLDLKPTEIRSCGGGARSRLWLQLKANLLHLPVNCPDCQETTVLGAAILGASSLGWGSVEQLASNWVHIRTTLHPQPSNP